MSPRYQREWTELVGWLQSALERLDFWNTQAVLVPQELESVRDHLGAFLVSSPPSCHVTSGYVIGPLSYVSRHLMSDVTERGYE